MTGASADDAGAFEATIAVGDDKSGRPLVAVYFTGQARTLNRTICSIERHLFGPLVRQGFTPVVFIVGESDGNEAGSILDYTSVEPLYYIHSRPRVHVHAHPPTWSAFSFLHLRIV